MRIQNNIMAMNTHRFYTANNNAVSKSAEKLSSGYRVNRAGDDAAGLAISEKMRAEIRGLSMASKNSQDGVSMVQTAEGALTEVHSMLQRMKELAVQASSDSNENEIDRPALDQEFQQLINEIDDVAKTTTFNDMKLLDGSFKEKVIQIGSRTGNEMDISIGNMDATALGLINQKAATTAGVATGTSVDGTVGADTVAGTTDDIKAAVSLEVTNANFKVTGEDPALYNVKIGDKVVASIEVKEGMTADQFADAFNGLSFTHTIDGKEHTFTAAVTKTTDKNTITFTSDLAAGAVTAPTIAGTDAAYEDINLLDQESASQAIDRCRNSINQVSTQRAELGAIQNRLEHKISNLDNTVENVSAAEARIRDVDIAKEMTNFTKNQILSQAATAMLAQANSLPQNVLSLLQ